MKCPYCAEEIRDDALKCRYCGEWLGERTDTPSSRARDYSAYGVFSYRVRNLAGGTERNRVLALDLDEARRTVQSTSPPGRIFDLQEEPRGKFSCPSCRSPYTGCHRAVGCVAVVIIFVSLGLGLIMIPFLPYDCHCLACGYAWKS